MKTKTSSPSLTGSCRVISYVRVSSEKQTEGASLDEQQRIIAAFCERKGLHVYRNLVDVQTAAKVGRKNFEVALKLLRQGHADGIVFHKVDRSSRNQRDWLAISELMDAGRYVGFAGEGLESSDASGRLTMDLLATLAAHYIRNLREEATKGLRGRVYQGLWPWSAPMGYLNWAKDLWRSRGLIHFCSRGVIQADRGLRSL